MDIKLRRKSAMKERFVKRFTATLIRMPEEVLNKFLETNPDYRVVCMVYDHQGSLNDGINRLF